MMRRRARLIAGWAGVIAGAVGVGVLAAIGPQAQPAPTPTPPAEQPAAQPGHGGRARSPRMDDPKAARAFLDRLLSDMDKWRPVLEEATRRLDAGESIEQVRAYIRENGPVLVKGPIGGSLLRELDESPLTGDGGRPQGDGPGGMRQGHGERSGGAAGGPPTPEERQAILAVMNDFEPGAADWLIKMQQDDPKGADRRFTEARIRFRPLLEMRRDDPQMYQLRLADMVATRRATRLARAIIEQEKAPKPDQQKVAADRAELRTLAVQAQNARIATQTLELARVEEKVTRIRANIQEQAANNDRVVDALVESLLGGARSGGRPSQEPGPDGSGGPSRRHRQEPGGQG